MDSDLYRVLQALADIPLMGKEGLHKTDDPKVNAALMELKRRGHEFDVSTLDLTIGNTDFKGEARKQIKERVKNLANGKSLRVGNKREWAKKFVEDTLASRTGKE